MKSIKANETLELFVCHIRGGCCTSCSFIITSCLICIHEIKSSVQTPAGGDIFLHLSRFVLTVLLKSPEEKTNTVQVLCYSSYFLWPKIVILTLLKLLNQRWIISFICSSIVASHILQNVFNMYSTHLLQILIHIFISAPCEFTFDSILPVFTNILMWKLFKTQLGKVT